MPRNWVSLFVAEMHLFFSLSFSINEYRKRQVVRESLGFQTILSILMYLRTFQFSLASGFMLPERLPSVP